LNALYNKYRDRAAFYFVYIEEAHASDAWQMAVNEREKVVFATPRTFGDRAQVGVTCVKDLRVELPMVVDDIDNRTERAYTAWPDRLYVIDAFGRVAYKSAAGPFGFEIEPVGRALGSLLR
jgi:type I thyroxine 5'-deiodinase